MGVEIVVEYGVVGVELKDLELIVESVKVGERGFDFIGARLHSK